jgi:hypothetical protein
MPRFYFNFVHGSDVFEDPEGAELPDRSAAREQAILAARDIMRTRFVHFGPDWSDWSVHVCDEGKSAVIAVPFDEARS